MEATLPPRAIALFELNMFTALQDSHKNNWTPMSSPPALNEKQLSKNGLDSTVEEVSPIEMAPDFATIKMLPEIAMINHPAGDNESVCQTKSRLMWQSPKLTCYPSSWSDHCRSYRLSSGMFREKLPKQASR